MSLTFYWNVVVWRDPDGKLPTVYLPYPEDGTNRGGAPEPCDLPDTKETP